MSLSAATRSETAKQFTTSMWWILAIVLFVYVGFVAAVLAVVFSAFLTGVAVGGNGPVLSSDVIAPTLYSVATSVGYVFPLLLGTIIVTSEFRHKTLTPTFLATPRRGTVLTAKLLAGVVVGLLFGAIAIIASVAPAAGILAGFGLETQLADPETWAMIGRMLLAFVLWVFVGIGVGTLVRNQIGAVVGVLVFTQFIEPIARAAASIAEAAGVADDLDLVAQYLPGAASDALAGASVFTVTAAPTEGLEWWAGGAVLLGYAVVLLVLGGLTSWRRDVS